jgi:hypothetical protein
MLPDLTRRRLIATLGAALTIADGRAAFARHGDRSAAHGDGSDALAKRIAALAAGTSRLFVLRANSVVALDDSGREIGRCPRFASTPPERPRAPALVTVDAEAALHLAGLPDDDFDSPEAEDVLDDEDLTPRRPPRPVPEQGVVARALAASPASDDVWIATSAGLYRGRGHACPRVALSGRDIVAIAAGGDGVAVATADLLWRSDGGGTFRVAAGLVARPRAIAVVDAEHTLIATEDAIVEIGPFGVIRPVLDHGADALAVCDGLALALAGDGVWTWSGDAPPERAGDRPPARTVTCGGAAGARFVAAGGGLFTSADGASWREAAALRGRSVGDAAAVADRLWVAVDDQLVTLGDPPASLARRPGHAALLPPLPPLATERWIEPLVPWPKVTLVFAGVRTPLRSSWSLVALLAFRFGRTASAGADRRLTAAELTRRDTELAAEEIELANPNDDDSSRTALLRAARQEREALR